MKLVSLALAAICAIAFVLVAPIGAVAFNVDRNVLFVPVWTRAMEEARFADAIRATVVGQLRDEPDAPFQALPEEDLQLMANTIMPAETMQPLIEEFVTQWVAFGRAEREDIAVPMTAFTHELQARFPASILAIIADKPVCPRREDYGSFTCRPPPADQAEFEQRLNEAATQAWSGLPQTFTIAEAGDLDEGERAVHRTLVRAMSVAPYIALGLLAMVALLAARGVRGFLVWIGVPLMVGGALVIGCWLLSNLILREMIKGVLEGGDTDQMTAAVVPMLNAVLGSFVQNLMVWGAIGTATGFGMTIAGSFMPRVEDVEAA